MDFAEPAQLVDRNQEGRVRGFNRAAGEPGAMKAPASRQIVPLASAHDIHGQRFLAVLYPKVQVPRAGRENLPERPPPEPIVPKNPRRQLPDPTISARFAFSHQTLFAI